MLGHCIYMGTHPQVIKRGNITYYCHSLRKQPTFRNVTTGFPVTWRLRDVLRKSILMTYHCPVLGTTSAWSCSRGSLLQAIRSTTHIWVVTRLTIWLQYYARSDWLFSCNDRVIFSCNDRALLARCVRHIQSVFNLQCDGENREHLKYLRNDYCVMTNHRKDQDRRTSHKTTN